MQQCNLTIKQEVSTREGENLIEVYDSMSGDFQPIRNLQRISLGSIAKVCESDVATIDLVFKEIIAQLKEMLQKGMNVRLMFKIGRFVVKNGEVSWLPINEDASGRDALSQSGQSSISRYMVNSIRRS